MTVEMFAKERASIREFGFIDPLTVRRLGDAYEIIDGEQRWQAGKAEGITHFPCIVLDVDDDTARELTIILNDTRGQFVEERLSELVRDLAQRREAARLENLLPYDRSRLEQLIHRREIDWERLERPPISRKRDGDEPWVERVYRMPRSSASVIDEAIEKVMSEDGIDQDWRALEMIAADYLGS
jgi:ParB-like chromosome segregation protein Spo0J